MVYDLDSIQASFAESGGGVNSQNGWVLRPEEGRVAAETGHGPLAIAEAAEVQVRLHSTFQPHSPNGVVEWDVAWSGFVTSFVGADSSAQATVTVRIYELIPGAANPRGPVVFARTVLSDGAGAALQGVATVRMNGSDSQRVELPTLDPSTIYRLEVELECSSRVAFSVGATVCAFADEVTSGLFVDDWSMTFTS
ncbi:MAG: hypothetical protein AB8G26_13705 [Ilumatobacter sp.]